MFNSSKKKKKKKKKNKKKKKKKTKNKTKTKQKLTWREFLFALQVFLDRNVHEVQKKVEFFGHFAAWHHLGIESSPGLTLWSKENEQQRTFKRSRGLPSLSSSCSEKIF